MEAQREIYLHGLLTGVGSLQASSFSTTENLFALQSRQCSSGCIWINRGGPKVNGSSLELKVPAAHLYTEHLGKTKWHREIGSL